MSEMSDWVKWAIGSIDKQLSELANNASPEAGIEISSLLIEKARLKANPQEQRKCNYPMNPRPGRR